MGVALLSARWLGPTERGQLVIATTLGSLLLLASSCGAGAAARVVLAEPGRWWSWSRYTCLAAALTIPHIILSGTVGLFLLVRLSAPDTGVAIAFLAYSATALSAHLLREGLHGLGRHRTSIAIDVGAAIVQLSLITAAHAAHHYSPTVGLYIGCLCFAGAIVIQVAVGRSADAAGRTSPRAGRREWWRQAATLLRFSRFALIAALGQNFVVNGDRLVLGAVGRSSEVGYYSAAATIATVGAIAPVALTGLLTRKTAESGTLASWRRMHVPVLALSGVAAVTAALVGWLAVPILLGEQFLPARPLLPILCAAALPYCSYVIDAAACAGLRDLRTGALGALLGGVILIGAGSLAYPAFGTSGVALGVLLAYLAMAVTARLGLSRALSGAARAEGAGPLPRPARGKHERPPARIVPRRQRRRHVV
jgi:O-antigen/teichoic acid export membrane protein